MPLLQGQRSYRASPLPGMQGIRAGEDDDLEAAGNMEKKIVTMESLEMCKYCQGSGWLGMCGNCNLLCESCGGSGLLWIERARMRLLPRPAFAHLRVFETLQVPLPGPVRGVVSFPAPADTRHPPAVIPQRAQAAGLA
jgi:hypothetical protein